MDIIKLVIVFLVIIAILWLKKPLYASIIGGAIATWVLFGISLKDGAIAVVTGAFAIPTLEVLLNFYLVTYIQRMLTSRNCLDNSQKALNALFNDRRINTTIAPAVLGLLPAAAAVTICGDVVRRSTDGYLPREEQCAITSYFRHIPELFLPTYPAILVAIGLTDGRVTVSGFVIACLPLMVALFAIGRIYYLRKIPKDASAKLEKSKGAYWKDLFLNTWPLILTIVLIIGLGFAVYTALLISIVLFAITGRFTVKELIRTIPDAVESKILLNTWIIMIFKELFTVSGMITALPEFFSKLAMPTFLVLALVFFFGAILGGSQAIVALCMGMVMASTEGNALPIFVLVMSMAYAAMQVSPTHVCLAVCSEDYGVPMGTMIKKTIPLVLIFSVVVLGYYGLLTMICR